MAMTDEELRAWVERSCARQQVPAAITDPATLKRIGVLLGGGGSAASEGRAAAAPRYSRQNGSTRSGSKRRSPGAV